MSDDFAKFKARLDSLETGDRAALKRAVGTTLSAADGKAITVFYRCLPSGIPRSQEDKWFVVACISCYWGEPTVGGKPFEELLRELFTAEASDSTEHRITTLLDTRWDEDGYMMNKLVRLAKMLRQKSNNAPVDFCSLLADLIGWNHPSQYVQRKWARTIF